MKNDSRDDVERCRRELYRKPELLHLGNIVKITFSTAGFQHSAGMTNCLQCHWSLP